MGTHKVSCFNENFHVNVKENQLVVLTNTLFYLFSFLPCRGGDFGAVSRGLEDDGPGMNEDYSENFFTIYFSKKDCQKQTRFHSTWPLIWLQLRCLLHLSGYYWGRWFGSRRYRRRWRRWRWKRKSGWKGWRRPSDRWGWRGNRLIPRCLNGTSHSTSLHLKFTIF